MATHSSVLGENPRDGGAQWAAVYGTESDTTEATQQQQQQQRQMKMKIMTIQNLWDAAKAGLTGTLTVIQAQKQEKSQINNTKRNKNKTQSQQKPADGTASISCYQASLGEGPATASATHHSGLDPPPTTHSQGPGSLCGLISDTGSSTAAGVCLNQTSSKRAPTPFPGGSFSRHRDKNAWGKSPFSCDFLLLLS